MIRLIMLAPKAIGTKVGKSSEKKSMDVDEYGIPMIFSSSPQEPMQDIYVVSSGDDGGASSDLFEEACGTSPVPARQKGQGGTDGRGAPGGGQEAAREGCK